MNYDSTDLIDYFSGLSAEDCRTLSGNLALNFKGTLAGTFTCTDRFIEAFTRVPECQKNDLIQGLLMLADAKEAETVIDYGGMFIHDENPEEPTVNKTAVIYHLDFGWLSYAPPVWGLKSFWIEHKIG